MPIHHKNARVLIVDDDESFRSTLSSLLEVEGFSFDTASDGVEAINAVQKKSYDIILLDVKMPKVDGLEVLRFVKENYPDTEVMMLTGSSDIRIAVECMKRGAYDYLTKPATSDELMANIDRALERRTLLRDNLLMKSALSRLTGSGEIVGRSVALQKVLGIAAKVAPTDSTVLIQGPSGTGKELIANFIYKNSPRKDEPFVTLDCASIPETLIESELFGHEKGAFTDAHSTKQGLVEMANGGTLFLDEIGDISAMIQPKLLRFIQTGEFRRVGGTTVLRSDVRIISATNKDLVTEVEKERFREDLLYRINVITIQMPPLKERTEDIPILVENFLNKKYGAKTPKRITPAAMEMLMNYEWPGNIRELENVLERAAILCQDNVIDVLDLSLPLRRQTQNGFVRSDAGTLAPLRDIERQHIEGVLHTLNGNKPEAAKILGISLKTLYTKIHQYHIMVD